MADPMEHESRTLSEGDLEEISRILFQLNASVKNSQLYPLEHPRLRESNARLLENLKNQIQKRGDIVVRFIENQLVFYNTPLYELSGPLVGLAQECLERHFQSITFSGGITQKELTEFIKVMTIPSEELKERGGIQEELLSRGISHITVERLASSDESEEADEEERILSKKLYRDALSEVKKAVESAVISGNIENIEGVKNVVNNMMDSIFRKKSALLGLTSIKSYDEYTFHHSVNVGILSVGLGSYLSLRRDLLEGLGIGGLLHDIGKTSVPERILNKPGKLDGNEWNVMRRHPVEGARILRKTPGVSSCAPVVAFEHHIKYDLSGYPSLVRQRPLSSYSLVVGIADCYDAMTTLRPYQKPRTQSETLKIMLELIGKDFEPRLMNRFVEMIGTYPVGSFVRLDTNEFAVVYDINFENADRPKVKLVINSQGNHITPARKVDLTEKDVKSGRYKRSIIQALNPTTKGINIANYI
jgi:HD-GYP domain-containing protein (c-di-GMP phosphodiesterase class II)